MRKAIPLGAITALLVGCTSDKPAPTALEFRVPLFVASSHADGNEDMNLGTHLAGRNEVFTPATPESPTPADSRAQGEAIFRVRISGNDTFVDFRLIASNIDNVVQSHIHCGSSTANGPIRMWLYPVIGPSGAALTTANGRHVGELASGTFSPTGVFCPGNVPLLQAMRDGGTYVNVHTNDFVGLPNTGPGDFPGGEIRGQLEH